MMISTGDRSDQNGKRYFVLKGKEFLFKNDILLASSPNVRKYIVQPPVLGILFPFRSW